MNTMYKIWIGWLVAMSSVQWCISQTLLSQGKESWSSEIEGGNAARNGNDGALQTRWASAFVSDAWWTVDLGDEYYVSRVEFDWENAYAKEYKIQISNSRDFSAYTDIAHVTNGKGSTETTLTDNNTKGRYVRFQGISRQLTAYGYSFWECRVYGVENLKPVPVVIDVPYVQYLELGLSPADQEERSVLIIQNTDRKINLIYNEGSPLCISVLDFRGHYDVVLWTLKKDSETDTIKGLPLNVTIYENMEIHVTLLPKINTGNQLPVADAGLDKIVYAPENSVELNGSRSIDGDGKIISYKWEQRSGPTQAVLETPDEPATVARELGLGEYKFRLTVTDDSTAVGTDDVLVSVVPPEQVDFGLLIPSDKAMITTTRKPTLEWETCSGAEKYEIFVNITRDDYEWYASGNLLDRYTKVGESTKNTFTLPNDLVDRWTYKWYVVATTASGMKYSSKQQFGLYIPVLEQENDGVDIVEGCRDMNKNGSIEPFEDWKLTPEERLDDIMNRLTRDEMISQLFYGGNENPLDGFAFSYGVEGGMRTNQYNAAKTRMGIPIGFFGDKVHGWKTIYPTQLGLAATRDMDLVYRCGNLHRIEQKGFGFTGTLAPLAEVDTKALYPRFQEGSGENADDAAAMIRALVCGMQGGPELNPHSMMTTVKHWPSQGAGGESALQYDAETIGYHMKPWLAAVDANATSVMPGYNTAPFLDPSGKGANSSKPIIDYLRNEIKFKGFVITDWLAANTDQSIESIGVGINVLGGAPSAPTDFDRLVAAVGMEKIEESVRKVLDTKIRTGMFENPYADPTCVWTNAQHHQIVLDAARQSITLLKNNGILPLKPKAGDEIIVAGSRATWPNNDNDPNVIWQSIYYSNPQAKTYLKAITDRAAQDGVEVYEDNCDHPKVAVIVIGEKSYTHGTEWENKRPDIPEEQLAIIREFKEKGIKTVTIVILPRPYVLTPTVELSDAVLAVYRGGNGIGQAVSECIFGDFAPSGKLPFQLPRSTEQIGTDNANDQVERWELPYDIGATDTERLLIRKYMASGLNVPPVFGDPLFQYGYGIQGFENETSTLISEQKTLPGRDSANAYPNPFTKQVYVDLPPEANGSIHLILTDIAGRIVLKKEANGSRPQVLDVSACRPGAYFLLVCGNDVFQSVKLIKK